MQSAALPPNEPARLASLYRHGVLDTEREAIFDNLAELAATICEAPIALISLVDESRQWFKAKVGFEAQETSRAVSFCAHAILQPDLFVVPDTLHDHRFADNPLVIEQPNIRFYAGAPLFTPEGHGLGTLCVIDRVPRQLAPGQQNALLVLRAQAEKLLELRRVTRDLETANLELDAFNQTVSHDLRVPLRAINGFSEILVKDHAATIGQEARDLLQRISGAGLRMEQMITDLLNLSRLSHHVHRFGRVNLTQLAQEAIAEFQKMEPARRVAINIHPELIAIGDPGLLRIAVENLLGNAWKYTAKCSHAEIEFGKKTTDDGIEFFVRDNGIGFDMTYAAKLFQPLQRFHSPQYFPGSGMGLATVKRIIQRNGGTIRAQSAANQGTTIFFTLRSRQSVNGQ